MDVTSDGKLQLFEGFIADGKLPKVREREARERADLVLEAEDGQAVPGDGAVAIFRRPVPRTRISIAGNAMNSLVVNPRRLLGQGRRLSWLERVWRSVSEWGTRRGQITVQEAFASLKDSAEQITLVADRAAGYETLLRRATQSGQTALLERLLSEMEGTRSEVQLIAMGLTSFLREETVVALSRKSPRAIRLDWISNFTRPIPADVLATKVECDERRIFDNYAVMHYDPSSSSAALTKAQVAAKKDPILFGVCEGVRKLYFVGDWIDEQCDLTLEKVAEMLGTAAEEIR